MLRLKRLLKPMRSMQMKVMLSTILVAVLALLIIVSVFLSQIPKLLRDRTSEATLTKLQNISSVIDVRLQNVVSFMNFLASNMSVNSALQGNAKQYTYAEANLVGTLLKTGILTTDNMMDSIVMYTNEGKVYAGGNGNYLYVEKLKETVARLETDGPLITWQLVLEENPNLAVGPDYVLSLYYPLRDAVRLEPIGIINASLLPDKLVTSASAADRNLVVLDDTMHILYDQNAENIGQVYTGIDSARLTGREGTFMHNTGNNDSFFMVYTTVPVTGWKIIERIPESVVMADIDAFVKNVLIVVVLTVISLIVLAYLISVQMSRSLRTLNTAMDKVQQGDHTACVEVRGGDEVAQLGHTFNQMTRHIRQLIAEIYTTEEKKHKSDMLALQAQINPHFLYNTLNSIHWMAVVYGFDNISKMVNALVQILRYSLHANQFDTTVAQEVEMLNPYLLIQNVRYNNGVSFSNEIETEALDCAIPRLLLQPLVENAISHGLRPKSGAGTIRVWCRRHTDLLLIDVTDNGVGFSPPIPEFEPYDTLVETFPKHDSADGGIGLENTNDRIKVHFGEQYGLLVRSPSGEGSTVRVVLPLLEHHGAKEDEYAEADDCR